MKKTININLGGQPFIIDEQAYDILHRYFDALRQKFTDENESKEILSDIEARVAEVFTQRLAKTRAVINEEDVMYIISLMGQPDDIAGESAQQAAGDESKARGTNAAYTGPVEKKLFRDPDNKKVGGVISGLSHYFGWGDPTWIRVVLVGIILISMYANLGIGFPIAVIYFILLIVVPEANTSAEKLQMRGQPVTIQNIEKEVRDAMTTAGNSFNTMVKNNNVGGKIGGATMVILRGLARIVLVVVIFICAVLMLALVGSFFGLSLLSSASFTEITHLVVSSRYTIMLFNVGLFLAIGIPLISIMYDSIRYLANGQSKNPILKRALWSVWFIGLIILFYSSYSVFKYFAASDTTTQKVMLMAPKEGLLKVQLADTMGNLLALKNDKDDDDFQSVINISGMSKTAYGFAFSDLKLEVTVSPDTNFYVEKVSYSRGTNPTDANRNIQMMHYKFSQTDATLNLDDKFELPTEGKWRAQKLKLRIYVPEGKSVKFADNISEIQSSVSHNDYFDDGMLPGKTIKVENGKVTCLDCGEKIIINEDKSDDGDNDDEDSVKTKSHHNLKNVSVTVNQNGVSLTGNNDKAEKVKIKVNEQGVKVITTDTLGNTKVTNK